MEKDTYTPNKPFLKSLSVYILCIISSVRKLAYGKIPNYLRRLLESARYFTKNSMPINFPFFSRGKDYLKGN